MFKTSIFTLNKISHDAVEVIAEENVFAYAVINENNSVTVKFPGHDSKPRGCITHESFDSNAAALDEIARIRGLIGDAEKSIISALRCGALLVPYSESQETVQ